MAVNQIILQSKMKAGAKVAYTCWLSNSTAILGLKVGWGQFENVILHSFLGFTYLVTVSLEAIDFEYVCAFMYTQNI